MSINQMQTSSILLNPNYFTNTSEINLDFFLNKIKKFINIDTLLKNNILNIDNNINYEGSVLENKIKNYSENDFTIKDKISTFSKIDYLKSFEEAIFDISNILKNIEKWTFVDSTSFFINFENFNDLPDDLDISIHSNEFNENSYKFFLNIQNNENISDFKILDRNIANNTIKEVKNLNYQNLEKINNYGGLIFNFFIKTSNGLKKEVELFFNQKGNGYVWNGDMPVNINLINNGNIKLKVLNPKSMMVGPLINLVKAFPKDNIKSFSENEKPKIKTSTRINYLLTYFYKYLENKPENIITQLEYEFSKFAEYSQGEETPFELYLKQNQISIEEIKELFYEIINKYNRVNNKNISNNNLRKNINFRDFNKEIYNFKQELGKIYKNINNINKKESISQIKKKYLNIKEEYGEISKSNFAFFYELYILKKNFILKILKKIRDNDLS